MLPEKNAFPISTFLMVCVATFTLCGCATAPRGAPSGSKTPQAKAGAAAPVIQGVQYATATGNAGSETAEVFIYNPGSLPVTFKGAYLDGVSIYELREGAAEKAREFTFDLGGPGIQARKRPAVSDPRVIWSQFQPSPEIPPGGFGILQVGFRGIACHSHNFTLSLETADGARISAVIPRHSPPGRHIMAVTWSPDGSVINVQYSGGTPPQALMVDGTPLPSARILEHSRKGSPGVVCAVMPRPAEPGVPVLVTIDFGGGRLQRFMARALRDIVVDAPNGWKDAETLPEDLRLKYAFDANPAIKRLNIDVACDDTRAHREGHSATDVIDARRKAYSANPGRLYGVEFCQARYKSIWNIYTPMADAVFAKPYKLGMEPNPELFIESEIEDISRTVAASAPRPVVWVPERYKRGRHVEGRELEVMAWAAFLSGARGVCYHYWKNDYQNPFAESVDLPDVLAVLNHDLNKVRPVLSQLVPAGKSADRASSTILYEGWAGDSGVLLLVRNMRYSTDGQSNDGGRNPRFRVAASENIRVKYTPPPWLQPGQIVDPISGDPLESSGKNGNISIRIPRLESYKLVWIPNTDHEALTRPFAIKQAMASGLQLK